MRPRETVNAYLDRIADTMFDCVDAGTSAAGILPGGLDVPRRARALAGKLAERLTGVPQSSTDEAGASSGASPAEGVRSPGARAWVSTVADPMRAMDWVNLFALAVNEENAAGHRVVTAPTNGAAGVIPAVLGYLVTHCPETGSTPGVAAGPATQDGAVTPLAHIRMTTEDSSETCSDDPASPEACAARRRTLVHDFLLAATADRRPYQDERVHRGRRGRLPGRGRIGLGDGGRRPGRRPSAVPRSRWRTRRRSRWSTRWASPATRWAGLVQVPCIERNAIAAVKAINAARMALWGDGRHTVSLDAVIETMRQTGNDMLSKYKETSRGRPGRQRRGVLRCSGASLRGLSGLALWSGGSA